MAAFAFLLSVFLVLASSLLFLRLFLAWPGTSHAYVSSHHQQVPSTAKYQVFESVEVGALGHCEELVAVTQVEHTGLNLILSNPVPA